MKNRGWSRRATKRRKAECRPSADARVLGSVEVSRVRRDGRLTRVLVLGGDSVTEPPLAGWAEENPCREFDVVPLENPCSIGP